MGASDFYFAEAVEYAKNIQEHRIDVHFEEGASIVFIEMHYRMPCGTTEMCCRLSREYVHNATTNVIIDAINDIVKKLTGKDISKPSLPPASEILSDLKRIVEYCVEYRSNLGPNGQGITDDLAEKYKRWL